MLGMKIFNSRVLAAAALVLSMGMSTNASAYTHETGIAPIGVVRAYADPVVQDTWGVGCASVIFRYTTLLGIAWFDAIAPYTQNAVGIKSSIPRRPASESLDNRNRNIAIIYASYRLLLDIFPESRSRWRQMMREAGLNPNNERRDLETPQGIGNTVGDAVVAWAAVDGMNQDGKFGGCQYNCLPYQDYTGWKPTNTAYDIIDASKWAPWITTSGNGIFTSQTFVTPQYKEAIPYSYDDPSVFSVPAPLKSDPVNWADYVAQADIVLERSAALAESDALKLRAELFDNKYKGYAGAINSQPPKHRLRLNQFVWYYLTTNLAAYDAGIAAWQEKYKYNSVRPYTAIPHIYGDSPVTAWGGKGEGLVHDLPASEWRQYLNVADHPEYPSGSGVFCAAIAQAARRYLGTDDMNTTFEWRAGDSFIEPGITPAASLSLTYDTWTQWETECLDARVDGGVHFPASVEVAPLIGHPVADLAYEFVQAHINGTAGGNAE